MFPIHIKTIPRVLLNTNTRLPESSILLLDANEHHPWWDPLCTSTSPGAPPFERALSLGHTYQENQF
ncbi:hypothetical protein PTT_16140 [Pyrenophora teres f. teres 0-1]|uniref:Uncharacterized protein n=1 Tax=Pyrenophora teres f. teres (strain 0-1) TaxID=861557 RepID=E3S1M9_PYRTT|nr:hypothetical protein PTT_16140 [Pyrenophora teres f. teres 0-1]